MNARKIADDLRDTCKNQTAEELLSMIAFLVNSYNEAKFDLECTGYKISVLRQILQGRRHVEREARFKKSETSLSRRVKK